MNNCDNEYIPMMKMCYSKYGQTPGTFYSFLPEQGAAAYPLDLLTAGMIESCGKYLYAVSDKAWRECLPEYCDPASPPGIANTGERFGDFYDTFMRVLFRISKARRKSKCRLPMGATFFFLKASPPDKPAAQRSKLNYRVIPGHNGERVHAIFLASEEFSD